MRFNYSEYLVTIGTIIIPLTSFLSYILDWAVYLILIVVFLVIRRTTIPRYHEFGLDNDQYSYTFYQNADLIFPNWLSVLLVIISPLIQIVILYLLYSTTVSRKIWNIHCCLLGFLASQSFQVIVVSVLKNIVGAPRPDLIMRCIPISYVVAPVGFLSNVSICSNHDLTVLNDGFRSFPSAHASTSFTSGMFLFLMYLSTFKVFSNAPSVLHICITFAQLLIAFTVSASRYSDNRHFLIDLVFGGWLGIISALIGYHIYFPWVFGTTNVGNAHPPRLLSLTSGNPRFWKLPEDDTAYEYDTDALSISEHIQIESSQINGDIEAGILGPREVTSKFDLRLKSLFDSNICTSNK